MIEEVPNGWTWTTLGEIGRYLNGRGFKKSEWSTKGRPIIRIQDLTGSGAGHNFFEGDVEERHIVRDGDLLMSWAATLDAFIWRGSEAVLNQHIFKVESAINRKLHYYLLKHVLSELYRSAHGSGMVHVTKSVFESVPVTIPPTEDQEAIVEELEKQFTRRQAAIEYLNHAHRLLQQLHARVLTYTSEDDLIPLKAILKGPLANGRSVVTDPAGFPVLRLTALKGGHIDVTEKKRGAWSRDEALRFLIKENDFLISRGNGSLSLVGRGGLVGPVTEEIAYPDTMIRARVDTERISPKFLRLIWDTGPVRRQIERAAKTTAGIYKVNQQDLTRIEIPVPSIDDQLSFVTAVDGQLSLIDQLQTEIGVGLKRAESLRRSILAAVFSGKLESRTESLRESPA